MQTRQAVMSDVPALQLLEAGFPEVDRFSARTWRRLIAGASDVWVTIDPAEGGLAAAAVLLFRKGATVARLYSLVVSPEFRGKGLARSLMDVCIRSAVDRHCDRMRLEVREANLSAISLYESMGFTIFARAPAYYADGATALRMEKRIGHEEGIV